ncbi:MAG TPA: DUF3108 domain-containing protein [Bryobacteraceae bacterium]|jgi:hypothetical protein
MHRFRSVQRAAGAPIVLLMLLSAPGVARQKPDGKSFPFPEKLTYRVEWRMVTAGSAVINVSRNGPNWQTDLHLESSGFVSRFLRVLDTYHVVSDEHFCGINSSLEAREGKRHAVTTMLFDNARHKLSYSEQDFVKNTSDKQEIDIAPCTHETLGALQALRQLTIEQGKTITFPITNGKKMVDAKVEARNPEKITVNDKKYSAFRYEAFIFDNVLYRRKGRLFVWMTDDAERVPVQLQFQMGFPIGNITLQLEKQEKP